MKWYRPPNKNHFKWNPLRLAVELFFVALSLMIPQFLRPTLSCMVHPHQPSKVQGRWCCKVVMVIWFQKVIVGESYKHANRFQEFWDCWKFSKHDSEIRIHYYIQKSLNLQVIFWTLGFYLTFHHTSHNCRNWDLLEHLIPNFSHPRLCGMCSSPCWSFTRPGTGVKSWWKTRPVFFP